MDRTELKQSHGCYGLESLTTQCCLSGIALPVLEAHSDPAWLGDLNQPAVKAVRPALLPWLGSCQTVPCHWPCWHPELPDCPVLAAPRLMQMYTVTLQTASGLGIQPMLNKTRRYILPCMHPNACVLAPQSVTSSRNKPVN